MSLHQHYLTKEKKMPKKRSRKNPNISRTQVLANQIFKALNPRGSKALKKRQGKLIETNKPARKRKNK